MNYLLAFALSVLVATGCSFKVGGTDSDAASGDVDMASDSTDMAGGDVDMTNGGDVDMTMVCTPAALSCNGGNLSTCKADGTGVDVTTCDNGCTAAPTPHCSQIYPTQPITRDDFGGALLDSTFALNNTAFNTDTGLIQVGMTVIRGPNPTSAATREIVNGIAFHTVAIAGGGSVGIWSFNKLTISAGTNIVMFGVNAGAWVSVTDINIFGTVDNTCNGNVLASTAGMNPADFSSPGPGAGKGGVGGAGATNGLPVAGGGTTAAQNHQAGGGGGGFGEDGSNGGKEGGNNGGVLGAATGMQSLNPLRGGSGGGAGGLNGGVGGGGGGALALVAQATVTLGNGVSVGGINSSGCGGRAGGAMTGGGGGGSGGAVLIEAPTIHFAALGGAIANGGGGGGGSGDPNLTGNGAQSQLSTATTAAGGGTAGTGGGTGAPGGVTGNTTGGTAGSGNNGGGGGGGGVGRIRLNSRTGAATLDANHILSPKASDNNMPATEGTADLH